MGSLPVFHVTNRSSGKVLYVEHKRCHLNQKFNVFVTIGKTILCRYFAYSNVIFISEQLIFWLLYVDKTPSSQLEHF